MTEEEYEEAVQSQEDEKWDNKQDCRFVDDWDWGTIAFWGKLVTQPTDHQPHPPTP